MHRLRYAAYAVSLLTLFVLGCNLFLNHPPANTPWTGLGGWAEAQLETLTLEQKVSHLFSSYAYGRFKSTDDPTYTRLVDLVERFEVGGLIFLGCWIMIFDQLFR